MNHCETCLHRNDQGNCKSPKLDEDDHDPSQQRDNMLLYSYTEGGSFWVGPQFGCVHHTPKPEGAPS